MTSKNKQTAEPAHDLLHHRRHPLEVFFSPKRVAVIGASETAGSVGHALLRNLLHQPFGGTVFPVNPNRTSVQGIKAFPRIEAISDPVDLAVIATPAVTVPEIVRDCVAAGVMGAIVISAGFKETGPDGIRLEREIREAIAGGEMRLIGPNCLGVMSPPTGLNATFAGAPARPGNVAFLSQSGALCTAILDWSLRELFGFSAFVSIGSMLDVGWGDLIDYLGDDPRTQSIVIYMESVGDARSFLSAAREVAMTKPILVIKTGRSPAAAKAAASHTGALTGSDEVLEAAFRRSGVLRVNDLGELFDMTEVLAKQPRPHGNRLMIITNAGGPGVLATDALIAGGGELAVLSEKTREELDRLLPPHWSRDNPVDILGDAGADRYARAVACVAADPNSDGLLAILAPQAMADPTQTAEQLRPYARLEGKPILASWMGGPDVAAGEAILNRADIPVFPFPDAAVRLFNHMWRYSDHLRGLYETPSLAQGEAGSTEPLTMPAQRRESVDAILRGAIRAGRLLLTEVESKSILSAYGIPTVRTETARSEAEAVRLAAAIGYPVVLKVFSETVTHKTDVGGVRLHLDGPEAVREAYRGIAASVAEKAGEEHFLGVTVQPMIPPGGYELIVGSSLDPEFGPVLLFGSGGQLVEVFRDRSLGLPPLNSTLARRMIEQTQIYTALKGVRGRRAIDLQGLEQLLVRFAQLVIEHPRIREIDINPLLASHEPKAYGDGSLLALDARVVLHAPERSDAELPRPVIRPYPVQYVEPWTLKDGTRMILRPVRPEDEPMMVRFHQELSEESVYLRYRFPMTLSQRIAHERLTRICFIDYDRVMVLVAEHHDTTTGAASILGAGRLSKVHGRDEAEFAVLISDRFQRKGLGTEILRRLLEVGRREGLHRIFAETLAENPAMERIFRRLGFQIHPSPHPGLVRAEFDLLRKVD